MKRFLITTISMLMQCLCLCHAQKTVRLIDAETQMGIKDIVIANEHDILCRTNAEGVALIPRQEGKVIFAHELYDRVELSYDSIPELISLQRRTYALEEVEVLGKQGKKVDKNIFESERLRTDMRLAAIKPSDANLLAPLGMLLQALAKKKKQNKRKRLEDILDKATKLD